MKMSALSNTGPRGRSLGTDTDAGAEAVAEEVADKACLPVNQSGALLPGSPVRTARNPCIFSSMLMIFRFMAVLFLGYYPTTHIEACARGHFPKTERL